MADAFLIDVDISTFSDNFALVGHPWTFDEIEAWLTELGFYRSGTHWIGEGPSIVALRSSEFRVVQRL